MDAYVWSIIRPLSKSDSETTENAVYVGFATSIVFGEAELKRGMESCVSNQN